MEFGDAVASAGPYKQSAPRSRLIATPTPHHSIFTGRMLFLTPNWSTEGVLCKDNLITLCPQGQRSIAMSMSVFCVCLSASISPELQCTFNFNKFLCCLWRILKMTHHGQHRNGGRVWYLWLFCLGIAFDILDFIFIARRYMYGSAVYAFVCVCPSICCPP